MSDSFCIFDDAAARVRRVIGDLNNVITEAHRLGLTVKLIGVPGLLVDVGGSFTHYSVEITKETIETF